MEAIILLAGYGSRLDRNELPHKGLLPFGEETLLSRHLKCFQVLGIQKTHLILGHNAAVLKSYVQGLNLDLPVHFIDNPVPQHWQHLVDDNGTQTLPERNINY